MGDFQNRRQVALNVLAQVARIAGTLGNQQIASDLHAEADHLKDGEFHVLVCGEAKRGKSSLLNAFVEEIGLCPVDAPVATNAITTIRYGKPERILVHYKNLSSGKPETATVGRSDLLQFVTEQGNPNNKRQVTLVEISIDNPKLADGLVLFDTPGVGSLNVDHTAVTYGIIPWADAVLFTGSADRPLTEPELNFAARIGKYSQRMTYVLTKRDRVDNWDERLLSDLAKLETAMNLEQGTLRGIAVSSNLKAEYLDHGDEDLLNMSGFADLERELWSLLGQSSSILLGRSQGRVLGAIPQLRLPLQLEKKALESKSAAEIKELETVLQGKIARANELSAGSAFWIADLNSAIGKLQADCAKLLADQFAGLHQGLANYLRNPDYLESPEKLGTMLSVDCSSSFAAVIAGVEKRIDEIVLSLREATKLDIEEGPVGIDVSSQIEITRNIERKRDSFFKKASDIGRSSTIHSMGLGSAAGIAGAVIGGLIGVLGGPAGILGGATLGAQMGGATGAFIGGIFGLKRAFSDMAERDMAALRQNLAAEARRQLDAVQRNLTHDLSNLLTSVRSDIHKDMIRQMQQEQSACQKAVDALALSKREKQTDWSSRVRDISNHLKMLDHLEVEVRALEEKTAAQNRATA